MPAYLKVQRKRLTGEDVLRVKGNKELYQSLRLASRATVVPAKGDLEPVPKVLNYTEGRVVSVQWGTYKLQIDECCRRSSSARSTPNVTLLRRS